MLFKAILNQNRRFCHIWAIFCEGPFLSLKYIFFVVDSSTYPLLWAALPEYFEIRLSESNIFENIQNPEYKKITEKGHLHERVVG